MYIKAFPLGAPKPEKQFHGEKSTKKPNAS
jgi:hypothetical protein